MAKEYLQAILKPENIVITNPNLNMRYIEDLVERLKSGEIAPDHLETPRVRVERGQGYLAADGNHKLTAYQLAGIPAVKVNLYSLGKQAQTVFKCTLVTFE